MRYEPRRKLPTVSRIREVERQAGRNAARTRKASPALRTQEMVPHPHGGMPPVDEWPERLTPILSLKYGDYIVKGQREVGGVRASHDGCLVSHPVHQVTGNRVWVEHPYPKGDVLARIRPDPREFVVCELTDEGRVVLSELELTSASEERPKAKAKAARTTAERDRKIHDQYTRGLNEGEWMGQSDYLRRKHRERWVEDQNAAKAWLSSLLKRVSKLNEPHTV